MGAKISMSITRIVLVLLGFLITLGSTVLSSFFIARSNQESQELIALISRLTEARTTAQANIIESSTKADSASIMFALAQSASNPGAKGHLLDYSREAIEDAFCFKCAALQILRTEVAVTSRTEVRMECGDSKQLLDGFFGIQGGDPHKYVELLKLDESYRQEWQKLDKQAQDKLVSLNNKLNRAKQHATWLRSIGTGLGLFGLMIVMLRDLVS